METVRLLLDLPFETLALLATGYLGYRIAFVGRDAHHAAVDVTFLSLVFAAFSKIATMALRLIPDFAKSEGTPVLAILGGAICAVIAAVFWRRFLQGWVFGMLRRASISDHDGQPDVWRSMMARQLKGPQRLVVKLKDGSSLMCGQLAEFNDAPMGPCLFGMDGSVALYVTDSMRSGSDNWTTHKPFDPEVEGWGYEMTFVPASEIARIDVTRPS